MRILYIEDDPDYARLVQTFLADSALKPEVDLARTMHDGIAKARTALKEETSRYDVVLLDLLLPDSEDPVETFEQIFGMLETTPIIVMTSMYDESLIKELIDRGARSYLIKPQTNHALLIRTLEFVLTNQQIRDLLTTIQVESSQSRKSLTDLIESCTKELITANAQLSMRDEMLSLTVELQRHLLSSTNIDNIAQTYMQIVERLGQVSGAGRAYFFEVSHPPDAEIILHLKAEWSGPNVVPMAEDSIYTEMPYRHFAPFWTEAILNAGDFLHEKVSTWDEPLRQLHKSRGTESILLLPVLVKDSLVGIVGLDRIVSGNELNSTTIELLGGVTSALALWIEQRQADEKTREINLLLRNRNEDLDAYAHTVAHDLKNPLSILVGTVNLLTESNITLTREEEDQLMQQIGMYAERATNIVDELLLLANSSRNEVCTKPVNMADIVNSALLNVRHLISERNATIIQPDSWPMAVGYAPWLEVVWVNYLSNAIKYGGTPPRIEIGASRLEDDTVEFWVSDNGRGLSADQQQQLFLPFKTVGNIPAGGHGLGLSIVKRVLDKLHGTVAVSSEGVQGKGSRFSFTLPALTNITTDQTI